MAGVLNTIRVRVGFDADVSPFIASKFLVVALFCAAVCIAPTFLDFLCYCSVGFLSGAIL